LHSKRVRPPHRPAAVAIPPAPLIPVLPVPLLKQNRPVTWLAGTSIVLVLFLLLLPSDVRLVFWNSLQSQATPVSLLLIFGLVAISLVWTTGQKLDSWVFLTFNLRGRRPVWLDQVMSGFTQIGSGFAALGIALVLFLTRNSSLAYELLLGTLTLLVVVSLVKWVVRRARPFISLTQARIVGYRPRGRSFPSGHTSQSFFIATLMIQHFHVSLGLATLLYSLAFMVGVTRMYVGAHYPRDVLAGAILGTAWGLVGVVVDNTILNRFY